MLTSLTQDILTKQSNLKKLEDNTYLTDTKNENYKYIKAKFFNGESDTKAQLLNVGSGLFYTIGDKFATFTGNPDIDLGENIYDFVMDMATIGFCTIGLERSEDGEKIVYYPAKNYCKVDGYDSIVTFYQNDNTLVTYYLVQSFIGGTIINKLYATHSLLSQSQEVPLETIPQTSGLLPIVDTGFTKALYVVPFSRISYIERIKDQVYAIERHIVMQHTQYLQHADSYVLFTNINFPEPDDGTKKINFSKLGKTLTGYENSDIKFINNSNDLIETIIKDNPNFIRRISATTTVPPEYLGLDVSEGAVGQGSRELRQGDFFKKIQEIRDTLDKALIKITKELKIESYTRPDIISKTTQELADEMAVAREARLISHLKAVQKYNNYTEQEAQKELDLINSEVDLSAKPDTGSKE